MPLPVKVGPTDSALRVLLYGQEGVGKTTWANEAPGALFLSCEDGGGDLDLARIQCNTWGEFRDYVKQILRDGPEGYKTLVVDTINGFERLLFEYICRSAKVDSIEEVAGGFGKGYTRAAEEMSGLQQDLDKIRSKHNLPIILLGHAHVKAFNDPNGPSYDKYELRMNAKTAAIWSAWVDAQLFACYDVTVKGGRRNGSLTDPTQKGKATEVSRVIYTTKDAAYDAKNRYNLPEELPLKWGSFSKAIGWDRRLKLHDAPQSAAHPTTPQQGPTEQDNLYSASMVLLDMAQSRLGRIYTQEAAQKIIVTLQGVAQNRGAASDVEAVWSALKAKSDADLTKSLDWCDKQISPNAPLWTQAPTAK